MMGASEMIPAPVSSRWHAQHAHSLKAASVAYLLLGQINFDWLIGLFNVAANGWISTMQYFLTTNTNHDFRSTIKYAVLLDKSIA